MIPSLLFELIRFLIIFGGFTLIMFSIYYYIHRNDEMPHFYLGKRYKSFFHSFVYVLGKLWGFLFVPLILYFVLLSVGFLAQENFSRVITVYDSGKYYNYSKGIVVFPQILNDGKTVYAFEKVIAIQNNSSKELLLKENKYRGYYDSGSISIGNVVKILPNTTYYWDWLPDYILEPAPSMRSVKRGEYPEPRWSLEIKE